MDGRTNESPPVFYRTLSPLGPLPCFLSLQFIIMQSRAKGIADHMLSLGDLFGFYSLEILCLCMIHFFQFCYYSGRQSAGKISSHFSKQRTGEALPLHFHGVDGSVGLWRRRRGQSIGLRAEDLRFGGDAGVEVGLLDLLSLEYQ